MKEPSEKSDLWRDRDCHPRRVLPPGFAELLIQLVEHIDAVVVKPERRVPFGGDPRTSDGYWQTHEYLHALSGLGEELREAINLHLRSHSSSIPLSGIPHEANTDTAPRSPHSSQNSRFGDRTASMWHGFLKRWSSLRLNLYGRFRRGFSWQNVSDQATASGRRR